MRQWARHEGLPFPLGVSWVAEEAAYNFAIYSMHAERILLLLYRPNQLLTPVATVELDYLTHKSGRIWHCRLPAEHVAGAQYYAYQVSGPLPQDRLAWHAFDPDKLLLDPYARAVYFPPSFERAAAMQPGSNVGKAPLGRLPLEREAVDGDGEVRPRHEADLVIYELHVKGFTAHPHSGVAPARRGTFAGVIDKIPYLLELGVTAVELMPVFQYDPAGGEYWGYMPVNFFAPHHAYSTKHQAAEQHHEFREMVKALHAADIEVILDVVYNHTGEGDQHGPTYSFKGLDNSIYYLIDKEPARAPYANFSGTGNTLNCASRYVRRMILDSMRYWVQEMHVDGFRFDLASIFTRNADGTLNWEDPPIFGDIRSDPSFQGIRLIAEPWDAGGGYELGHRFPGYAWLQWNGRFRDDVRRFLRGDPGLVPALMQRLYGSDDLFPDDRMNAYHPFQSVNYLTCHDGFTLYDLVAYNQKRNWANGHGNQDGPEENFSWNCGWEGDEAVPAAVQRLRRQQIKNFACLLFLSNGTPMVRAGDEFLQTQGGNNNPYNQDNETSWLDWDRLRRHADVFRFFRGLIAFRKRHPSLCRSRFWRDDVRWYGVGATPDLSVDSHSLAVYLRGASQGDADLYMMINGYWEALTFVIQEGKAAEWKQVIDTAQASPDDIADPGGEKPIRSLHVPVAARSITVLTRTQQPPSLYSE